MALLDIESGKLGYCKAAHLLRRSSFNITKERIEQYAKYTAEEALDKLFDFDPSLKSTHPLNDVKELLVNGGKKDITPYLGKRIIALPEKNNKNTINILAFGREKVRAWWLFTASRDLGIQYKLNLWLHLLFVADNSSTAYWDSYDYLELLRFHTRGSLRELAIRITKNLRMLDYLDNRYNSVNARNNNYAREFLELFTILKGKQEGEGNYTNYTEDDIEAAGRVFTGFTGYISTMENRFKWNNTKDPVTDILQGFIKVKDHDTGDKVFSIGGKETILKGGKDEASIQKELEQFVQIIFDCEETAKNYCRRLYRFFVARDINPEIEVNVIEPLAKELKNQDYKIEPIVKKLLMSKHFYSEKIIGSLIKSPLDLQMHLLSIFKCGVLNLPYEEVQDNDSETEKLKKIEHICSINHFFNKHVYDVAASSSFPLFVPVNVNGYAPYTDGPLYDKKWITTSSLQVRHQQADKVIGGYTSYKMVDGKWVKEYAVNILNFITQNIHIFTKPENPEQLLEDFYKLLFISKPDSDTHNKCLEKLGNEYHWSEQWEFYLQYSKIPEAERTKEINKKLSIIKSQLDELVKILLKAPEFQVM